MLIYNLSFGILITLLSSLTYIFDKKHFWILTMSTCIFYFFLDSFLELFIFKRLLYLPHHILSLIICFYFLKFDQIKAISLIYLLIESTSVIINLREILKNKKLLSKYLDLSFLIYYILIRCIIGPFLYFKIVNKLNIFTNFSGLSILIMSIYWSIIWSRKLLKKFKLNYKP